MKTTIENLTETKTGIEQNFTALREACERANNWSEIEPLFTRLHGGVQNLFAAVEA